MYPKMAELNAKLELEIRRVNYSQGTVSCPSSEANFLLIQAAPKKQTFFEKLSSLMQNWMHMQITP